MFRLFIIALGVISLGIHAAPAAAGTQTRTVVCKDSQGNTVADSYCTGPKPAASQDSAVCEVSPDCSVAEGISSEIKGYAFNVISTIYFADGAEISGGLFPPSCTDFGYEEIVSERNNNYTGSAAKADLNQLSLSKAGGGASCWHYSRETDTNGVLIAQKVAFFKKATCVPAVKCSFHDGFYTGGRVVEDNIAVGPRDAMDGLLPQYKASAACLKHGPTARCFVYRVPVACNSTSSCLEDLGSGWKLKVLEGTTGKVDAKAAYNTSTVPGKPWYGPSKYMVCE